MPSFAEVRGHDRIIHLLKNQWRHKRGPHSFIFAGPEGIGKLTCARSLVLLYNCAQPTPEADSCGKCSRCRMIDHGNFPELTVVTLEYQANLLGENAKRKNLFYSIDMVHELNRRLTLQPPPDRTRFIIIDCADLLSDDASGALLKTLEEPPENTVFILITDHLYALLSTIRSRSQIIRFAPPDMATFLNISGAKGARATERDYYACNASPGAFLSSSNQPAGAFASVDAYMRGEAPLAAILEELDALAQSRESVDELLEHALTALRAQKTLDLSQVNMIELILTARQQREHFVNHELIALNMLLRMRGEQ